MGVGIEYRKYYSKKKSAPQGKYLAFGFGSNLLTNNTYNGSVVKTTSFSGKFVLGRQWIYNSKFTIDFNGGITYVAPNFKINTIPQTQHVSGPLPAINISLGYIFK